MDKIIKKIVILFIVVCCLLSFMEISCLAQTSWGKAWNGISYFEKQFYLTGVADGLLMCIFDFTLSTGSYIVQLENQEERMLLTASMERSNDLLGLITSNSEVIINIMNDLYEDPANVYIICRNILDLACRKIKGENIEPLLQEARKKALQN
ncbi:MAG: hypothetical protein IMZ60_01910 [Actinobacteria bacterium]|nr:hypothetical protein [Actinomycetota bacterium]